MPDYSKRGPCCDRYDQIKKQMRTKIKTLYALVGGNLRYWVQLAEIMQQRGLNHGLMMLALEPDNKTCPCNDAPNPILFREFYALISSKKHEVEDKQLPEIYDFLEKEADKFMKDKTNP